MDLHAPIIGLLHNTKLNRWHPIWFNESPMPGDSKMVRHKSKGHHTTGFETRVEAIESAKNSLTAHIKQATLLDPLLCLDKDFPWDGEDIPAIVAFFGEVDGVITPLF